MLCALGDVFDTPDKQFAALIAVEVGNLYASAVAWRAPSAFLRANRAVQIPLNIFRLPDKQRATLGIAARQDSDLRTWSQRGRDCPVTVPRTNGLVRVLDPMLVAGKGDAAVHADEGDKMRLTHTVPFSRRVSRSEAWSAAA